MLRGREECTPPRVLSFLPHTVLFSEKDGENIEVAWETTGVGEAGPSHLILGSIVVPVEQRGPTAGVFSSSGLPPGDYHVGEAVLTVLGHGQPLGLMMGPGGKETAPGAGNTAFEDPTHQGGKEGVWGMLQSLIKWHD